MGLFFLTFFLIYGGFHLYFFLRIRAAFAPGTVILVLLIAVLLLGMMAPIIVRVAESHRFETLPRIFAWIGYLWMAVLFLFCLSSLLLDLYRLLAYLIGPLLPGKFVAFLPSARTLFLIPFAAALGMAAYGCFEASHIRTERIEIRSEKIPKEAGRIRVVQISDVHIGVLVRGERLAGMLRKVRETEPDLLVSTGDLVDGQGNDLSEAAAQFRGIRPRHGKYAVTGNHEFYVGIDHSLDFMVSCGFVPLRGEAVTVAGSVELVGVDDPAFLRFGPSGKVSDREVLSRAAGGRFTILLKHQPLPERDAIGAFDLQLSGHTHKGQIFPFSLITRLVFPFHSGNFQLADGALLHVSRGTGTWGPPIRFLAPPEITVIDLLPD